MRIGMAFIAVLGIALAGTTMAGARTWYVKPDGTGDAPTIQHGINYADVADTVLLSAGTYMGVGNRDIDFLGKAITLASQSGPEVTIIDCQGLGTGFLFISREGPSSVLSGLTIRNARDAAILVQRSSPTICRNAISRLSPGGAPIWCDDSSPAISGNIISENSGSLAGGIFCIGNSYPTISNNTITGNSASQGGGIYCLGSSPASISNNIISNNRAGLGGGICCDVSSPVISGNTINGNRASEGAGIWCRNSSPTISGNTISDNSASEGGGIYCYDWSSPIISGNTISGNSAMGEASGGGIFCGPNTSPSISSTIIAFSTEGGGIYCLDSNPTLTNCDIYGNAGGDALCGTDGGGNISTDPLFCDQGAGNFHLNCTSPCVNNPGCGQIGAFGVGCGPTAVQNTTWGRIKSMFR
jgi:parallel beta-helix repeat protein